MDHWRRVLDAISYLSSCISEALGDESFVEVDRYLIRNPRSVALAELNSLITSRFAFSTTPQS